MENGRARQIYFKPINIITETMEWNVNLFLQNIVLSWLLTQELSKELPFLDNKLSNKTVRWHTDFSW